MRKILTLSFVLMLFLSTNVFAAWHTATGTSAILDSVAQARDNAINDAIRNLLMENGADIKIEQSFKNGVLSSDSVKIQARSPIRQLIVIEEQKTANKVTVKIKALIDEKNLKKACNVKTKKNVLPIAFKFADNEAYQASLGVEGLNKEIGNLVYRQLATSPFLNLRPILNVNLVNPGAHQLNSDFESKNIQSLAKRNQSQLIIVGKINSLALSKVGNALTSALFNPTRSLDFDIEVYDGVNGDKIFSSNYQAEADWEFSSQEQLNFRSDRFKGSAYGQRLYDLVKLATEEVVQSLQCIPLKAKVIEIEDNDDIVIDLGKSSGIYKGMEFNLDNGGEYSVYIVDKVNMYDSSLRPKTYSNTEININDTVTSN